MAAVAVVTLAIVAAAPVSVTAMVVKAMRPKRAAATTRMVTAKD